MNRVRGLTISSSLLRAADSWIIVLRAAPLPPSLRLSMCPLDSTRPPSIRY